MYLISTEGYKNANVEFLRIKIKTASEIWVSMKDVVSGKKKQIYKKFTNLSQGKLNTTNNKKNCVKNNVMTTVIKRCREEKTRGIRAIDGFRNELMIPDSEIPKCSEFEVKSKIGKIFKKHNPLEEYSVKIYEIDPYFYEHYEKKYKLIKMGVNIYYLELMFISINFY